MRYLLIFLFTFYSSAHSQEISKELQQKLDIVIPVFEVKNKSIEEVLTLLRRKSMINDPHKKGINIVYLDSESSKAEKAPIQEDAFGDNDPFSELDGPLANNQVVSRTYSFQFENMPLGKCIKYICLSMNVKYRIDRHAIVVASPDVDLKVDEWSNTVLDPKISSVKFKLDQLKKELALLQKILSHPPAKTIKKETLKENVIISKLRFDNRSLSQVAEYIERQTAYLTKDKKKIPVAIYIPANVKLAKFSLEANNLPVLELAKYIAEQLKIETSVEKEEIVFRERKPLKISTETYKLNQDQYLLLIGSKMDFIIGLKKYGITFPENTAVSSNGLTREVIFKNTEENHKKLKLILDFIE